LYSGGRNVTRFEGIARFNELQRATGGISKRVLTAQLRQLERDGIVTRKVYDSSPLRVGAALRVGRGLRAAPSRSLSRLT